MDQGQTGYSIYGMSASGNCYKLKLLMQQLGLPYHWHEVDIFKGETKTQEFLNMNPVGEVPLLQLPDRSYLAQSNAILFYLAKDTPYYFNDRRLSAEIFQWMFFEQYSHEPYIAVARKIKKLLPPGHPDNEKMPELERRGNYALGVMQRHLQDNQFFVDNRYSIADISLYAYTHVAYEGGFDLNVYPAIVRWLDEVKSQPGYVDMN